MSGDEKLIFDRARTVGEAIGIDWGRSRFDVEQFRMGLEAELEHGRRGAATSVTGVKAAKSRRRGRGGGRARL